MQTTKVSECMICFMPTDPEEYYLKGHIPANNRNVLHLFDQECIHQWLQISPRCPACNEALIVNDLIQVSYISKKRKIKKWVLSKLSTTLTILSTAIAVSITHEAASLIQAHAPKVFSGLITGTKAVIITGLVTAIPMIHNKLANKQLVNQNTVNKIYLLSVALGALSSLIPVHDSTTTIGLIAGGILTSIALGFIGEAAIKDKQLIQHGLPNDYTTSNCLLANNAITTSFIIGTVAASKFAAACVNDRHLLIRTISTVFGGIAGLSSNYMGFATTSFILMIGQLRYNR